MFLRFCVGGKGISIPNGNGDMLADGNDGLLHSAAWVGGWHEPSFGIYPKSVSCPTQQNESGDLEKRVGGDNGGFRRWYDIIDNVKQ